VDTIPAIRLKKIVVKIGQLQGDVSNPSRTNSVSVKDSEAPTEKKPTGHDAVETAASAAKTPGVPPVGLPSFFSVGFTELFANFIGLICAAGAGAAKASLTSPFLAPRS